MYVIGIHLRDGWLVRNAFQQLYGVGEHTARRLCARFQIHDKQRISDLSQSQVNQITTFLTSPSATPSLPTLPLAPANFKTPTVIPAFPQPSKRQQLGLKKDTLKDLKIEAELRREMRENIAHHRMIGSYVGRRHAMGLPVRGQRTKSNSMTARKLNKIERKN